MRVGDDGTYIGAVIDDQARKKILNFIEIGMIEGRILFQAEVPKEGFFVGPTIFEDILPNHRLAREEIFGPVLVIMKVKDLNEALEVANEQITHSPGASIPVARIILSGLRENSE